MLILPGNPLYLNTITEPAPGDFLTSDSDAYVIRKDSLLFEKVNEKELDDYLEGGEYDDRLGIIEQENILYLPEYEII